MSTYNDMEEHGRHCKSLEVRRSQRNVYRGVYCGGVVRNAIDEVVGMAQTTRMSHFYFFDLITSPHRKGLR